MLQAKQGVFHINKKDFARKDKEKQPMPRSLELKKA